MLRDDFFADAKYLVRSNEWIANLVGFNDIADYVDPGDSAAEIVAAKETRVRIAVGARQRAAPVAEASER